MNEIITWILIALCLTQSAIFSGLTIGIFGLGRLRLEIESEANNKDAIKILQLRRDSNFLLTTMLWGNVGINVLIALLTDSVMAGTSAFLFSTFGITCFGEIAPQAYFSRNALSVGAKLTPLIRFYQMLLYPVAKPTALILDWWLGREKLELFREQAMRIMLEKHIESGKTDIGTFEGIGALNFLSIDDVNISDEGSLVDPRSVISLSVENNRPVFPVFNRDPADPFLQKIEASGRKWVIITNPADEPVMVLDADGFLRDAVYKKGPFIPLSYCHFPVVVKSPKTRLEKVIRQFKVYPQYPEDDVIDQDLILYWGEEKRIVTGSDILGRLLRGIVVECDVGSGCETPPAKQPGIVRRAAFRKDKRKEKTEQSKK
ncbi:Ancient conserved domain protein 4 [Methanosarcina siciliae T4/M]|uniref:Ancient conserved domain protein 4 n=1 Tax=Methanosarcina siciliae T4/M TaxID=1434120 RepID=A0A0E3P559_9EURY|nr:hemolysin family protein [Methanosarcina siciliae]AKB28795.1 Ancient conserved domain protein 4 [Methanosarcina siciliae T4/M]